MTAMLLILHHAICPALWHHMKPKESEKVADIVANCYTSRLCVVHVHAYFAHTEYPLLICI